MKPRLKLRKSKLAAKQRKHNAWRAKGRRVPRHSLLFDAELEQATRSVRRLQKTIARVLVEHLFALLEVQGLPENEDHETTQAKVSEGP